MPQILSDLEVVYSFTPQMIYNCLTFEVRSHNDLKIKLKQRYEQDSFVDAAFRASGF